MKSFFLLLTGLLALCFWWLLDGCRGKAASLVENISSEKKACQDLIDSSFRLAGSRPYIGAKCAQAALLMATRMNWEEGMAGAENAKGHNYFKTSCYDEAYLSFSKALSRNLEPGNKRRAAANLCNIGAVFNRVNDFESSIKYLDSAAGMYRELGDTFLLEKATILLDKAGAYYHLERYDESYKCTEDAINIYRELDDTLFLAEPINNEGNIHFVKHDYLGAAACYAQSRRILLQADESQDDPTVLTNLGLIYVRCSDEDLKTLGIVPARRFDTAMALFSQAYAGAEKSGNRMAVADVYQAKSELYEWKKDDKNAWRQYKAFHALSDSIANSAIRDGIAFKTSEAKYEYEKQRKEKEALEREEKDREGNLAAIAGGIFLSIVLLAVAARLAKIDIKNKLFYNPVKWVAGIALAESMMYGVHYFLHHYVTDNPFWLIGLLIVISTIISRLEHWLTGEHGNHVKKAQEKTSPFG